MTHRWLQIQSALLIIAGLCFAACARGEQTGGPSFADRCSALVGKQVARRRITEAKLVVASAARPLTCQVYGEIASSLTSLIKFQADLPEHSRWNGKLLQLGGGGYNGSISPPERLFSTYQGNNVRQRGYVLVSQDSGHQSPSPFDLSFALNNPSSFDNFAFASTAQVLEAARAIVKAMYRKLPSRTYFYGVSTGGREALQQAQRYPTNYDGIIALEPGFDYGAISEKGIAFAQLAFKSGGSGWINARKIELFDKAQLAACDSRDGVEDGIISNAEACHFNVASLRCPEGVDSGDSCLSDSQIASIESLRSDTPLPAPLAHGLTVAPPLGVGAEAEEVGGWGQLDFGPSVSRPGSFLYIFAEQWLKFAVTSDPNITILSYTPGANSAQWMAASVKANATDPQLHRFAAHGGKLILWHGWSDHLVPPGASIAYYREVVRALGQPKTDSFMRFYMAPGVTHLGTGPGAATTDLLSAMENWVEHRQAPETLLSQKYAADGTTVQFSRPLCRYPSWPKYQGSGDAHSSTSYNCVRE